MADGDVLTIVSGHQAFAAPGAGAVATELLGPYVVNFDDTDIGSGTHVIGPLDPDLIVLNAWFFPTTAWVTTSGAPPTSSFYISVDHLGGGTTVASYDGVQTGQPQSEADPVGSGTVFKLVALTIAGDTLGFQAYADDGTLTQGVAAIYLLVGRT